MVYLTTNKVSDSQVFGDLLNQMPQDEPISSVCKDGDYDINQCCQAHIVIPP